MKFKVPFPCLFHRHLTTKAFLYVFDKGGGSFELRCHFGDSFFPSFRYCIVIQTNFTSC